MNGIIKLLVDIASQPALLVALIALIGLVIQKKSTSDIIKGTLKTWIGFVVLSAGADVVTGSLEPFGKMFQHAFNVQGVVPNNEAIVSMALVKYGTTTALIMFFGMLVNILIARFTKFKHIFLTGHHTLYMACMLAVIFAVAGFSGLQLVVIGSLTLGAIMSLSPFFLQRYMRDMTGANNIGLGHFGGIGYWLSGKIGEIIGKNSKEVVSTEDTNFPKGLSFLRDSTVSIGLTMMVIYLIVALVAGPNFVASEYPDGGNYIIFSLMKGAQFAAGVYIILSGVRLILNEILPAFKGISEKLVPNSIPALDCPIVFTMAPNAVLIGFFSSFIGGVVSLIIMGLLGTTIILPGVVPHFFCGATAGVFGNAKGGRKGAIIGAFIHGIFISFLPLFLMPVLGDLGFANSTFSDADFTIVGILFGLLGSNLGRIGVVAGLILVYAAIFGYSFVKKDESEN
ncbi:MULTISPECIES: PTS ascorbate transporter subunit IIC [Anaerococcus]|uniref:Ascorbate-specific PTS system EIIC component n=1 Tax=Anaerococcus hydrogenalis TaxID=33029 RepID=A0A2N6UK74_9FIRM|nr:MULTISPECIES: PTS ascorbate transporter subunit IIC [Anaerococcus]MDK7694209.1 PTS ascorbate transporter subunit IIC [Anaerococcus hydrogenalis]MDK7695987.1 PTS ascorbate transporter subunit IIC [Anaerococcus hydrogenalis]MDK7707236.1 PTS ascorbate transporter subunit IIC [Anaerococcus hydrogenalis]MDU4026719.1 PTS ascorbate transporter subunit IIC [Anaerococcus sp.]PMC82262.1 PTS ascorbate transporter subunit IIC [Anaerococcus hydrogenalis]